MIVRPRCPSVPVAIEPWAVSPTNRASHTRPPLPSSAPLSLTACAVVAIAPKGPNQPRPSPAPYIYSTRPNTAAAATSTARLLTRAGWSRVCGRHCESCRSVGVSFITQRQQTPSSIPVFFAWSTEHVPFVRAAISRSAIVVHADCDSCDSLLVLILPTWLAPPRLLLSRGDGTANGVLQQGGLHRDGEERHARPSRGQPVGQQLPSYPWNPCHSGPVPEPSWALCCYIRLTVLPHTGLWQQGQSAIGLVRQSEHRPEGKNYCSGKLCYSWGSGKRADWKVRKSRGRCNLMCARPACRSLCFLACVG